MDVINRRRTLCRRPRNEGNQTILETAAESESFDETEKQTRQKKTRLFSCKCGGDAITMRNADRIPLESHDPNTMFFDTAVSVAFGGSR